MQGKCVSAGEAVAELLGMLGLLGEEVMAVPSVACECCPPKPTAPVYHEVTQQIERRMLEEYGDELHAQLDDVTSHRVLTLDDLYCWARSMLVDQQMPQDTPVTMGMVFQRVGMTGEAQIVMLKQQAWAGCVPQPGLYDSPGDSPELLLVGIPQCLKAMH